MEAKNENNGEQLSYVSHVRPSRSKKAKQPTTTEGLNQMEQLSLEDEWCLALCESHLLWSVTDRPAMRAFLHHLWKTKINGQVPNRTGPVLNRVETVWSVKMETVKAGWQSSGVTIARDGWTDAVGRSIMMVLALGGDAPVL